MSCAVCSHLCTETNLKVIEKCQGANGGWKLCSTCPSQTYHLSPVSLKEKRKVAKPADQHKKTKQQPQEAALYSIHSTQFQQSKSMDRIIAAFYSAIV